MARRRRRKPEEGLLSLRQVALMLSVSWSTVKRWTKEGLLGPTHKMGRLRRWERSAVEAFLRRVASE